MAAGAKFVCFLLPSLLPGCLAGSWIFLGGYSGLEEGQERASGYTELLTLKGNTAAQERAKYTDRFEWCAGNFSRAPIDLGGHIMAEVNVIDFVKSKVGDVNYESGHHTTQLHRMLVCGGAEDRYRVQDSCLWWRPERDSWEVGPQMLHPRYQAAAISWPSEGMVWMLGGRDGSTILQDNEVLIYPQVRKNSGNVVFSNKRWDWAHKKMKNIEVWNEAVPGDLTASPVRPGMKMLPMPLAGHCAVEVGSGDGRGVLVLGGGTAVLDDDAVVQNSPVVPTSHVHFYHKAGGNKDKWSSSLDTPLATGTRSLGRMGVARMNHACLAIGNKVYVAGGVTKDTFGQRLVVKKVEQYDFSSNTWRYEADLPLRLTGVKLISVGGQPTVVGRYGTEAQERLLRYSEDKTWVSVPTNLMKGRSDFQVFRQLPTALHLIPDMNSKTTKMNPGSGGDTNWRNMFAMVKGGKRLAWKTNAQQQPWVQFDLGAETFANKVAGFCCACMGLPFVQVFFETGSCTVCDGTDDVAQPVEVRPGRHGCRCG